MFKLYILQAIIQYFMLFNYIPNESKIANCKLCRKKVKTRLWNILLCKGPPTTTPKVSYFSFGDVVGCFICTRSVARPEVTVIYIFDIFCTATGESRSYLFYISSYF